MNYALVKGYNFGRISLYYTISLNTHFSGTLPYFTRSRSWLIPTVSKSHLTNQRPLFSIAGEFVRHFYKRTTNVVHLHIC